MPISPRLAIDVTAAVHQGGGIGRYTRCLVQALASRPHGFRLTLFWIALPHQEIPAWLCCLPNVHLRRIPFPERWATILWHRLHFPLPIEALIGPQDICYFPDFVLPPVLRARTILTIHDLSFRLFPETADASLRRYLEATVPRSAHHADLILADSDATRGDIIHLLHQPPTKVHTLLSGVQSAFSPQPESAIQTVCARYQLDQPFILSVGTIQPRKNYARLIDAYSRLPAVIQRSCALVIAGRRGWLSDNLEQEVQRFDVQGTVHFLYEVSDADLPALYSAATVFVLLSLYEGFGLPPLEAMACGTPVLASNTSSLPEVVGDAGILVDPFDVREIAEQLRLLLSDPARRSTLAKQGVARARQFTWDRAAGEFSHYCWQLLESHSRHG